MIQVPSTVSGVGGTFTHGAGNGSLVVQGPLGSVPIHLTRTLTYGFTLHLGAPAR